MYLFFELGQTGAPSLLLSKKFIAPAVGIGILPWEGFYLPPKLIFCLSAPMLTAGVISTKTKRRKIMKNDKDNTQNEVVIILPEPEVPPIKRITIFLLGVSSALLVAAYINFNENLGLLALGIVLFLFIFDEGFRRIF